MPQKKNKAKWGPAPKYTVVLQCFHNKLMRQNNMNIVDTWCAASTIFKSYYKESQITIALLFYAVAFITKTLKAIAEFCPVILRTFCFTFNTEDCTRSRVKPGDSDTFDRLCIKLSQFNHSSWLAIIC